MNRKTRIAHPLKLKPISHNPNRTKADITSKQNERESSDIKLKRKNIFSYSPLYHIRNASSFNRNYTFNEVKDTPDTALQHNTHYAYDHPVTILTNEAIFERMRLMGSLNNGKIRIRDRTLNNPCVKERRFTYKQPECVKLCNEIVVKELMLDKFNNLNKRNKTSKKHIVYPIRNQAHISTWVIKS